MQIFSRKWERSVLLLGFLPAIFIFWQPDWLSVRWQYLLVTDLLFFSVLHVMLSFYTAWRSTEIRSALRNYYRGRVWKFHLQAAAIFTVSASLSGLFLYGPSPSVPIAMLFVLLVDFMPMQHRMGQIFGLSQLYDSASKTRFELSEVENKRLAVAAKWERRFHRCSVVGFALLSVSRCSRYTSVIANWEFGALLGKLIIAVGTLGLLVTLLYRPRWKESNQFLFGLRRGWEAVPVLQGSVYLSLQCLNHAFEYIAVSAAIEKRTVKMHSAVKAAAVLVGLIAFGTLCYLLYFARQVATGPTSKLIFDGPLAPLAKFLALTSLSLTAVHYFYDMQVFRFSKPEFRQSVMPLLHPEILDKNAAPIAELLIEPDPRAGSISA